MSKKTIILIAFILILLTSLVIFSTIKPRQAPKITSINQIKEMPDQTGGIIEPAPESEIQEGQAINNLIKLLPHSTDSFTIERYDYSKGKFVITFQETAEKTFEEFNKWLQNSEFRAIPKERFLIR